MGSLFGRRREEGGVTTGTCVWTPASGVPCVSINVLILNWLWGSQRLEGKKRVEWEMGSKSDSLGEHWIIKKIWKCDFGWAIICGCIAFLFLSFFFFSFLQQWWQMSVKLNSETSKAIFKWLFIGMLGGLTLFPLVSGDRESFFLWFILLIKKKKHF